MVKRILAILMTLLAGFAVSSAQTSGTYAKVSDTKLDGMVNPEFSDTVILQISGDAISGSSTKENRVITGKIYSKGGLVLFTAIESGGGFSCAIAGIVDGRTFRGSWHDNKGNEGDLTWTKQSTGTKIFNIVSVSHENSIPCGGKKYDLTVYWEGNPKFPVTATYMPRPGWNCWFGGCGTVTRTFDSSVNPLVLKEAIWCQNLKQTVFFDYVVVLKDADGFETRLVPAAFECVVKK